MLKQLLVTTAIVAIASSAYAADATNQNNAAAKTNAPAATAGAVNAPAINYVSNINPSDILASKLIGQAVYGGTPNGALNGTANGATAPGAKVGAQAQNNQPNQMNNGQAQNGVAVAQNNQEHIGDINDLVVAKDGSVEAVIIGVGGFLGMGQKDVAVPFDNLQWSKDGNGKTTAYLDASKDQLQNAPSFDASKLQPKTANAQAPAAGNGATPNNKVAPNNNVAMNNTAAANQNAAATDANSGAAVDATKISANDLMNTTVYDADNQNVGNVGDVIVTKDGKIDAVVVDIGGFLGIGEKPVAIAFGDLNIRKDQNGNLTAYTTFTKQQLDSAPKYDKNAYQTQRETMRLHSQG